MAHALLKEPFNFSTAQIANLTDYQLINLVFRPERDDEKALALSRDNDRFRKRFDQVWRNLSPEERDQKWESEGHGK